ncbi:MAG: SusC/RagA family TonB-linked outer membrane protein, partial [Bacteroidaceae bacterium]|nr:SusC/RagA family TonB-linked outer membrane protein [Bacteroidaceae bacterium]
MSKKIALIFTCLFAMVSMAFAQSRVTGVVTASEDGEPVMGASILVKGTSVGTTTDLDGKFTLAGIPSGSKTLVVSYIGMKTKEVAIKSNLSISLDSETAELEEVVVTAMGIQRQAKALGYATAKVNADELTAAKASDATAALSGKVSGLQINVGSGALDQQTRIQLRGARSFKGDNGALLVLDGVQTPMNFLQTLNPNDIDNISVLKGASAAALYGSEAANGVLIVTTKSGQKGKPQFTYGYTITMNKAAYMPKLQHRFGSGHGNSAYGNIWNYDSKNSYMSIENQQFGPEFDGLEWTTGTPLEALDGEYRKIMYTDLGEDSRWSYYKTGWAHQHDISYSASDDRGSMYLSYQRLDQSSTVPGDKTSRQTVRFNASRNFKNLTVSAKINYTHSNFDLSNSSGSAMYTLLQVPSNYWVADFQNWANGDDGKGNSPNEYFSDYSENPYFTLDTNRRSTRQDRVSGNIDATFKATKWLKFVARAGLNIGTNFTKQTRYAFHFSEWASNVKYNASSDQTSTYNSASQHDNRFNLDIMAMTEHQLGNFELKGMLGYSMQDNYSDYTYTAATQLAIDNFFNFSNKLGDLTANNRWSRIRKTGLFGSIDLSYKGFAFVQVTGRNDWTSLLDPSKRSFFYPSVNASFVFTDAIPSLKSDVINHWKMRASWAKVGTVNLQPYKLATLAQVNSSFPYGNTT